MATPLVPRIEADPPSRPRDQRVQCARAFSHPPPPHLARTHFTLHGKSIKSNRCHAMASHAHDAFNGYAPARTPGWRTKLCFHIYRTAVAEYYIRNHTLTHMPTPTFKHIPTRNTRETFRRCVRYTIIRLKGGRVDARIRKKKSTPRQRVIKVWYFITVGWARVRHE